jgi:predicted amidohydrolase YtcJ
MPSAAFQHLDFAADRKSRHGKMNGKGTSLRKDHNARFTEGHFLLPRCYQNTLGSIEAGKAADLVVIDERGGVPVVTCTLRDGREVLATG